MPAWLLPAIAAATSAAGGLLQNQSAAREARRNREFQERMSSTAAQRSVLDYRAAGLNPALAYDRPASSPGGSVAPVEDFVGKGVSSGFAAKQAMAQMELLSAQTYKTKAEGDLARAEANLRSGVGLDGVPMVSGEPTWREQQVAKRVAELRDLAHQGRLQPHDERLRRLAVAMQRALLKGAEFRAETFGDVDAVRDFIKAGLSSGRDAAEAFRAWMQAAGATRLQPPKPFPRRRTPAPSAPSDMTRTPR